MTALPDIETPSVRRTGETLELVTRLERGLPERLLPVHEDLRDEVIDFAAHRSGALPAQRHIQVLLEFCSRQFATIAELAEAEAAFQLRHISAMDDAERRAAIIEFIRALGSSGRTLVLDRAALEEWLDADAAVERYTTRIGERERTLAYALERMGSIASEALQADLVLLDNPTFVEQFDEVLARARNWRGDARIRRAAHLAMYNCALQIRAWPGGVWLDRVLSATRRSCLDLNEDAWVCTAAFDALLALSPKSIARVVERRLEANGTGDGEVFVKRHIARLVCINAWKIPLLEKQVDKLLDDADGAVRQAVAETLHELSPGPFDAALFRLLRDADPQVRAMLLAHPDQLLPRLTPQGFVRLIERTLRKDRDEFVLRLALHASVEAVQLCSGENAADLPATVAPLREAIRSFQQRDVSAKLMRWADEAHESIWLLADEDARTIAAILQERLGPVREGKVRRAKALRPYMENRRKVGRVMAVLAQRGFGITLDPARTPTVQKGEAFGRRMWRILYEMNHSATDKRQAFLHTIGRHYAGTMMAPSARMAELAPTKVPGEPLFESKEGGWRNYLPLLDQVLTALDNGGTTEIYTSAGITLLHAPDSFITRSRAFWTVTRSFAELASLRNSDPAAYVRKLREFGFDIEFVTYDEADTPNPAVTKFFSAGGAVGVLPILFENARAYLSTVYENSLPELAAFLAIACLWFFGRHMALGWRARRLRNGLSLVLGGWGTRGKSGTERLKAGLINAIGASMVSKTTGCEAMFIMGKPFGEQTEMFLFRPYDKATIWEQFNLLKTSRGLKARVFLWECMGLNPSYVHVLQQDWMRDDIATLTNTYPDHEDVQGPAGRNIPEVMCEFIPHKRTVLTTEEEMLPILQAGAQKVGSDLHPVTWKEAGLIHKTLLDRFPYEEHPYNIALVTRMGAELGQEADFCVKEMADRVVADLGVLKTYPRSLINGRTLEFVMGMSANERFGAMGNWTRMGFDQHDLARDPDVFVSTVVNNRADRVPRSRVFARMLVRDVAADRHFLIGSNIEGLTGFIEEEWQDYSKGLTLSEDGIQPLDKLEELAKRQRIALTQGELDGLLGAMLAPQSERISAEDALAAAASGSLQAALEKAGVEGAAQIAEYHAAALDLHKEYAALRQAVEASGGGQAQDEQLRKLLGRAFHAKIVPVRDYYIKGEAIVRLVAENTPPGLVNRIMGMQNIKGTGLDWVYRWQAWDAIWKACQQMRSDDPAQVEKGYRALATSQEFGALSELEVKQAVADLRARIETVPTVTNAQLDALESRLAEQMQAAAGKAKAVPDAGAQEKPGRKLKLTKVLARPITFTERFLDASDAVRRRRKADKVYKALITERISTGQAVAILKDLTTRQKGGWLIKALS